MEHDYEHLWVALQEGTLVPVSVIKTKVRPAPVPGYYDWVQVYIKKEHCDDDELRKLKEEVINLTKKVERALQKDECQVSVNPEEVIEFVKQSDRREKEIKELKHLVCEALEVLTKLVKKFQHELEDDHHGDES